MIKHKNVTSEIDELLEAQGWDVLRIPYQPPITEKGLAEIMATIKHFLNDVEEETIKSLLVEC